MGFFQWWVIVSLVLSAGLSAGTSVEVFAASFTILLGVGALFQQHVINPRIMSSDEVVESDMVIGSSPSQSAGTEQEPTQEPARNLNEDDITDWLMARPNRELLARWVAIVNPTATATDIYTAVGGNKQRILNAVRVARGEQSVPETTLVSVGDGKRMELKEVKE